MNHAKLFALIEDGPPAEAPKVTGKWFPIRLTPDLATGELFNVGVGFLEDGKRKDRFHVKLLNSARSFRCLYGSNGVENFTFLLTIVGEHLRTSQEPTSPSPHIAFGEKGFAAGNSVEEILDRLFHSVVTLRRHFEELTDDATPESISSAQAREDVFTALYRRTPQLAAAIVQREPLVLKSHHGHAMTLDIPLRKERRFGTIASAHYRKEVYVSNNLMTAMRDMILAREQAKEADDQGGIFILRAPTDGRFYTESWQRWIDEEIEKVREALFYTNISVREGSSVLDLCDEIRDWAQ